LGGVADSPLSYIRLVSNAGTEYSYPARFYTDPSIQTPDISTRLSRDPRLDQYFTRSITFGLQRGIVLILDLSMDEATRRIMNSPLQKYILADYATLVISTLQTFSNDDYISILSTDGYWNGKLWFSNSDLNTSCEGTSSSTSATDMGGLVRAKNSVKESLASELIEYFFELDVTDLINDSENYISSSASAAFAQSDHPVFTYLDKAVTLLRSAINPEVSMTQVLKEAATNPFGFSTTLASMGKSRPLPVGTPLFPIIFSLGSGIHPYFLTYTHHLDHLYTDASFIVYFSRLNTLSALHNGDLCTMARNLLGSDNDTEDIDAVSDMCSLVGTLQDDIEQTETLIQQMKCDGMLALISSEIISDTEFLFKTLSKWERNPVSYSEITTISESSISSLSSATTFDGEFSLETFEIFRSLVFTASYRASRSLLSSISVSRGRAFFDLTKNMACPDQPGGLCSYSETLEHFPVVITAERDPLNHNLIVMSMPIIVSDGSCLGLLSYDVSMNVFDAFTDNSSPFYSLSSDITLDLTPSISYTMLFANDSRLLVHPVYTSTRSLIQSADINEVEVIVRQEDDLTFGDLVLASVFDYNVSRGSVDAWALRLIDTSFTMLVPVKMKYEWKVGSSGMVFVVALADRDLLSYSVSSVPPICDSAFPITYDSEYSNIYDPFKTGIPCRQNIVYNSIAHLDSAYYKTLGYYTVSSEDAAISPLYSGMTLFMTPSLLVSSDILAASEAQIESVDDLTVSVAKDIADWFNGEETSVAYSSQEELIIGQLLAMMVPYYTYTLRRTSEMKYYIYQVGAMFENGMGVLFPSSPIPFDREFTSTFEFAESLFDNYDVFFHSPMQALMSGSGSDLEIVLPMYRPIIYDDLHLGITFTSLTISAITETMSQSVCANDGMSCWIFNSHGSVVYTTEDSMWTKLLYNASNSTDSDSFIGEYSPLLFQFLIDNAIFVDSVGMFQDGPQPFFSFNIDAFVDSITITLNGELITQNYVYGTASNSCILENADNTEILCLNGGDTNLVLCAIENAPDSVSCAAVSRHEDLEEVDNAICEMSYTSNTISHLWTDDPIFREKDMLRNISLERVSADDCSWKDTTTSKDRSMAVVGVICCGILALVEIISYCWF
ncbi:hypothetical protein ADUPG1_008536, partial [Aduncisulcus paluster]